LRSNLECAKRSLCNPVGLNPTRAKLSQQPVTYVASVEVTKQMKPTDGRYQAAARVNVVSPENDVNREADSV